jgi:thioredoxin reductase
MERIMNLIKSLRGRRQFLIATGLASTSAFAWKRLTGFETGTAMAAEKAVRTGAKAATPKYPHLLSPLRIRNVVLKNRIIQTRSTPHQLQGPENYPNEETRSFYSEAARNAAIVSLHPRFLEQGMSGGTAGQGGRGGSPGQAAQTNQQAGQAGAGGPEPVEGMTHFPHWDDVPLVHNYFDQLIEGIHLHGSLVALGDVEGNTIEEVVTRAKKLEQKGYDVVRIGSMDNSREALKGDIKKMQAVQKATDLLIIAMIRPFTPGLSVDTQGDEVSGPEQEEVVAIAKMLEGSADIIQMKDAGGATNHPNSFSMEKDKPWMLRFSQAIKESGAKIITCPTGGFHYPELNEAWIASGKCDMVGIATPFIADPEYTQKAYEGRSEDIVPCVMCHECHGINMNVGPWFNICTVNPKFGLSEIQKKSIRPPSATKSVAVIGGGPGGMKAALVAAERGHKVTLYEKSDTLGGQQRHTDFTQWKWAYKDFKDYLIRQVNKAGVEVRLKTAASADMIEAKRYDTVLVAIGAEPVLPKIPGANGRNIYNILDVYSKKSSLGKNVVIIGAGVFGTETGCCLAKDGYKVTVLASGKELMGQEFIGPHNKRNQIHIIRNNPNFSHVLEATVTRIGEGAVTYVDANGNEKSLRADSVVIYAGLKPRMDEAMKFSKSAGQVHLVGDCTGRAGTLQKTMRSAFFVASQV